MATANVMNVSKVREQIESAPKTTQYWARRRGGIGLLTIWNAGGSTPRQYPNADWGHAPATGVFDDCPVLKTAELILVDATRDPDAAMLADEFAFDQLRVYSPSGFVISAEFVRRWYREKLRELADDAESEFVVEDPPS